MKYSAFVQRGDDNRAMELLDLFIMRSLSFKSKNIAAISCHCAASILLARLAPWGPNVFRGRPSYEFLSRLI